jgi:hypothetical protein
MPISLENSSNIRVTYNTGSNYIIETVKSDLYVKDTVGTISNLTNEPTVISPTFTESVSTFSYTTGTSTTNYTITIGQNTICDILIVAGGGGGGKRHGGGGGAGTLLYHKNIILNGTYNIKVGKGGAGHPSSASVPTSTAFDGSFSQFVKSDGTQNYYAVGGGRGTTGGDHYANTNGGQGYLYDANLTLSSGNIFNGVPVAVSNKEYVNTLTSPEGCRGRIGGTQINNFKGGGGGGAGGVGMNHADETTINDGYGGLGLAIDITGTSVVYAGGGGGSDFNGSVSQVFDPSYSTIQLRGGGGYGSDTGTAQNGLDGTGGGGGGQGNDTSGNPAGNGGSGIVIIKFKTIVNAAILEGVTHKRLNFTYSTTPPNTYTLTFPFRTSVDVNNNSNLILQGDYNINVGATTSSVLPAITNTFNRLIPLPNTTTSTVSLRYHLLNPIKTTEGAQWTYSSSNANVYHLGSVGIGTTSPEYSLDVRGFIYSSSGGYTSSALTKWSVLSDRRIKENIVKASYEKCLQNVKNIELYNFNFKDNYVNTNDRHQLVFIAQEVQQIYPKAVEVSRMIMNLEEQIDDLLTLNTTQIDYTLYGSVKCLIQKLENIKIKMEQIKTVYNITT